MFVKALDLTFFGAARCLSSAQSTSYYGVMGACSPQEIFKKEQSEPLFPASPETKYQFPRQGTLGEQLHYFTKWYNRDKSLTKIFQIEVCFICKSFSFSSNSFWYETLCGNKGKRCLGNGIVLYLQRTGVDCTTVVRNEWKKLPLKAILCVAHNCNMCQNDSVRITIVVHVQVNSIQIKCTPSLLILPQAVHLS